MIIYDKHPTVCVTCVWAGVDSAWEQGKLEARKMLKNAAESHTSGARFVSLLSGNRSCIADEDTELARHNFWLQIFNTQIGEMSFCAYFNPKPNTSGCIRPMFQIAHE